jgi:AbrB family looped-hinge helix DNA binding protein
MNRGASTMPLVKVKEKFQVTLPHEVRKELALEVGDLLEAQVKNGQITLSPKKVIDRRLARALEDVKKGRGYGPFTTSEELIRSLHRNAAKLRSKPSSRS